jgi:heme ABC exporter ATP-binding subunit CcmA
VIEAKELSVKRCGRLILDQINLCINTGEIVVLLGSNGAGKSTLLRCLAGLTRPSTGEVYWFGQSPHQNLGLKRSVGMVAHQRWLYSELTPRENLLFTAKMYGIRDGVSRIEQLLAEAALLAHADASTAQLSHGMRQRLSICRALVHDPSVLLLDEPFSALDHDGEKWLEQVLEQRRSLSTAIFLTTHRFDPVRQFAKRVLRLECGRLSKQSDAFGGQHLRASTRRDAA